LPEIKGLIKQAGEFIYFVDSDDFIEKDTIEILYDIANRENLDVLYFDNNVVYEKDNLSKKFKKEAREYTEFGVEQKKVLEGQKMFSEMILRGKFIVAPWSQMIRTSFLNTNKIRFENSIIHEDNLFSFLVIMKATRTKYISIKKYNRRIREDSTITKRVGCRNCIGYLECVKQIYNFLENTQIKKQTAARLFLLNLYKASIKIYLRLSTEEKKIVRNKYEKIFNLRIIIKSVVKINFLQVFSSIVNK